MPELWHCIEPIDIFQRENKIKGPIGEIGVYHGKFFIGLALTKHDEEGHCAIDVFELQKFNLDNAGKGNLKSFRSNLENNRIKSYEAITADSLRLSDTIIDDRRNKYSLFSVDGCHTAEHTINDFEIALKLVKKEGVIFIDDYYNPNWPGVQEGMVKYYCNNTPNFVPLLFTSNKLFLCSLSYHKDYLEFVHNHLIKHYKRNKVKKVKRFGYDTLTVIPDRTAKKYIVENSEMIKNTV